MSTSVKFLHCIIYSFIIMWTLGCSNNKFCNDMNVSNINYIKTGVCSHSQFFKKNIRINDKSLLLNFFNKSNFINNNRYTYNYIKKGFYSSYCYQVKSGDTLFYIAWITGHDYHSLAKKNNIAVNDILKVGQILQVYNNEDRQLCETCLRKNFQNNMKRKLNVLSNSKVSLLNNISIEKNYSHGTDIEKSYTLDKGTSHLSSKLKKKVKVINNISKDKSNVSFNQKQTILDMSVVKKESSLSWCWPTNGKIINNFSYSEGGNKGIDISGVFGQPVFSAGNGKVVYAGDDLFGYGNLIIIKHGNDFLTTYAHNDTILVFEQQNVALGQKIATMGNSGSNIIKLHFEIRYKGESVNPLSFLPKK